jgi:hypothetical protein
MVQVTGCLYYEHRGTSAAIAALFCTKEAVMPHRIAERLRQLAIKCTRLADECTDKSIANELEGVGAELAQKA